MGKKMKQQQQQKELEEEEEELCEIGKFDRLQSVTSHDRQRHFPLFGHNLTTKKNFEVGITFY